MNNTAAASTQVRVTTVVAPSVSAVVPWLQLRSRVREGLTRRNYYVASSEDLSLLWRDERVDASERRRRITVFAAQHQWRVEARPDGSSARFQAATASGLREILSRNPE